MDILTQQEAEAFLGLEAEAGGSELALLITDVSLRLARHSGRTDWGPSAERTEYFDGGSGGTGTRFIMFNYWPVTAVSAVYDDIDHTWASSSLVDSSLYYVDSADTSQGVLFLESGTFVPGWKSVKVTYTGGWNQADIPAQIKAACRAQIEAEWLRRKPGRFIAPDDPGRALMAEVRELLMPYSRRVPFA